MYSLTGIKTPKPEKASSSNTISCKEKKRTRRVLDNEAREITPRNDVERICLMHDATEQTKNDDVHVFQASATAISASITGSQGDTYQLHVERESDTTRVRCSCPDFAKKEGEM